MSDGYTGDNKSIQHTLKFRTKKRYILWKFLEMLLYCGLLYIAMELIEARIVRFFVFIYTSAYLVFMSYLLWLTLGGVYVKCGRIWRRFPLGLRGRGVNLVDCKQSWHMGRLGQEELILESNHGILRVGDWLHGYMELRRLIFSFDESSKVDRQIRKCVESIMKNGVELHLGYCPSWCWFVLSIGGFFLSVAMLIFYTGEYNAVYLAAIYSLVSSVGGMYYFSISLCEFTVSAEGISLFSPKRNYSIKWPDVSHIKWGILSVSIISVSGEHIRCNRYMVGFDKLCILLRYRSYFKKEGGINNQVQQALRERPD